MPPQEFVGIPVGNFFCRRDGYGELKPDGDFPVAIPTSEKLDDKGTDAGIFGDITRLGNGTQHSPYLGMKFQR
jgi:hypothetical protein